MLKNKRIVYVFLNHPICNYNNLIELIKFHSAYSNKSNEIRGFVFILLQSFILTLSVTSNFLKFLWI